MRTSINPPPQDREISKSKSRAGLYRGLHLRKTVVTKKLQDFFLDGSNVARKCKNPAGSLQNVATWPSAETEISAATIDIGAVFKREPSKRRSLLVHIVLRA
jgi:hypothetical protein